MDIHIGTSGYSYKEWKGTFYPEDLKAKEMLAYYSQHFSTVEINNTFYRMPVKSVLEGWASRVPEDFIFVLKAPQRITHQKRLVDTAEELVRLTTVASGLGNKLGPILFQLPPYQKKDIARLREFMATLDQETRVAFEFRHDSWNDDEVHQLLRNCNASLCLADTDDSKVADETLVATATFGYLRLRRTEYSEADLRAWADRINGQGWSEAFVFFKHEDEGKGPRFATGLKTVLGEQEPTV